MSYSIDAEKVAEETLRMGLGEVPVVGSILSGLVAIFWPSENTTSNVSMTELQDYVSTEFSKEIKTLLKNEAAAKIIGLNNALQLYLEQVTPFKQAQQDGNKANMKKYGENCWNQATNCQSQIVAAIPELQIQGYEFILLPFFIRTITIYCSLMRDMYFNCESWGQPNSQSGVISLQLWDRESGIPAWMEYAWDSIGLNPKTQNGPTWPDYADTWNYISGTLLPYTYYWTYSLLETEVPVFAFEKWASPIGSVSDYSFDSIAKNNLSFGAGNQITEVKVWKRNDPDGQVGVAAFQLKYGKNWGPVNGPQQYWQAFSGQYKMDNYDTSISIVVDKKNPIIGIQGWQGDIIDTIEFLFKDGTSSGIIGKDYSKNSKYPIFHISETYTDMNNKEKSMILSSMCIAQGAFGGNEGYFLSGFLTGFSRPDTSWITFDEGSMPDVSNPYEILANTTYTPPGTTD